MWRFVAPLGCAALALAGCTPAQRAEVREDVAGAREQAGHVASAARQTAEDQMLEGKVKSVILTRKGMNEPGVRIDVEAMRGMVVLTGEVREPGQAHMAERVALETEGVVTVDNRLEVRMRATAPPPVSAQ